MIDTIKLFLPTNEDNRKKYFDSIRKVVELKVFKKKKEGKLKNIQIRIVDYGIFIEGSLTKYALGENLKNIYLNRVRKTIIELEETLGIPIGDAKVLRVDITASIILKKPLVDYLNCFIDCNRHTRHDINFKETLMFRNDSDTLEFYDKLKEMLNRKETIEDKYKDKNILRYEFQMKKNLKRLLKVNELTAKDLYDPTIYKRLIKLWYQRYESVRKTYQKKIKLVDCTSLISLKKTLASFAIDDLGLDFVMSEFYSQKNMLHLSNYYNIRKRISELAQFQKTENYDCVKELDKKIKQIQKKQLDKARL